MKIIGINDGHNATVCYMENGATRYVLQEERISREKNQSGFPIQSIKLLLNAIGLSPEQIDFVGMNGNYMPTCADRSGNLKYYADLISEKKIVNSTILRNRLKNFRLLAAPHERNNRKSRSRPLLDMGFRDEQISFIDHHTVHAVSAYFAKGNFKDPQLVLTNDGAGDRLCATVNIGRNGKLERITEIHENHSIGLLYAAMTFLVGMVPLEHEYKLMGMAPYADKKGARKVADEFWKMFAFDGNGLTWRFKGGYSIYSAMAELKEFVFLKRFDHLMGGLQLFTEEFLLLWIKNCIAATGISKLALSGGTFMNVKANKKIMEHNRTDNLFIFPSCGDESNAFGSCYYIESLRNGIDRISPLGDIYLGIEWTDSEIESAFEKYPFELNYNMNRSEDIETTVAELLADGHVVARFKGREEFGARSLGNRAILADAAKREVVREINEMIKNRDFWMPFACSVLEEDMNRYVHWDPSRNQPHYMIMTYDTKPPARTDLPAGIHPYDWTIRPQMVRAEHNREYWNLIKAFKARTGVGGVLNTSLNLHGLPLVHTPEDAFHVMEKSSLRLLAIGNYLIRKSS